MASFFEIYSKIVKTNLKPLQLAGGISLWLAAARSRRMPAFCSKGRPLRTISDSKSLARWSATDPQHKSNLNSPSGHALSAPLGASQRMKGPMKARVKPV